MPGSFLHPPEILRQLAQRIEEIESHQRPTGRSAVPLGIPALDGLLSDRGLPAGSLVELVSTADGAGAWTLGLILARQAVGELKTLVVVDGSQCFYPPAAARLGVDLQRSIVVRPQTPEDGYAAANLSLGCAAVGAVLVWCDRLSGLEGRRLQLAAEAGSGLGVLFRRAADLRGPSFAALRIEVTPCPSVDSSPRLRLDVVRCRGGKCGQSLVVEIDGETGDVRVLPEVAPATTPARTARTSG
jgi:hypothetical protein